MIRVLVRVLTIIHVIGHRRRNGYILSIFEILHRAVFECINIISAGVQCPHFRLGCRVICEVFAQQIFCYRVFLRLGHIDCKFGGHIGNAVLRHLILALWQDVKGPALSGEDGIGGPVHKRTRVFRGRGPFDLIIVPPAVAGCAACGNHQPAGTAVDVEGTGVPRLDLLSPLSQLDVIAGDGQVLDGIPPRREAGPFKGLRPGDQRHRLIKGLPVAGLDHFIIRPGPLAANPEGGHGGNRLVIVAFCRGPGDADFSVAVQIPHQHTFLVPDTALHLGIAHVVVRAAYIQRHVVGNFRHRDVDFTIRFQFFRQLPAEDARLASVRHPVPGVRADFHDIIDVVLISTLVLTVALDMEAVGLFHRRVQNLLGNPHLLHDRLAVRTQDRSAVRVQLRLLRHGGELLLNHQTVGAALRPLSAGRQNRRGQGQRGHQQKQHTAKYPLSLLGDFHNPLSLLQRSLCCLLWRQHTGACPSAIYIKRAFA